MACVTCPVCGSEVLLRRFVYTSNKPFCTRCGWNLERAEADLNEKTRILNLFLIVFLLSLAVVVVMAFSGRQLSGALPIVLLFGFLAFGYGWNRWSTKRAFAEFRLTGTSHPPTSEATPIPSLLLQRLQALPIPRRVKLRIAGMLSALLLLVAFGLCTTVIVAILALWKGSSFESPELTLIFPMFLILVILLGAGAFKYSRQRRKLDLLRNGEMAVARVLTQQVIARGKYSYHRITYEFLPHSGPLIRKTERDETKSNFEDMLIPVFYNRTSPDDCVAVCSTSYYFPDAES